MRYWLHAVKTRGLLRITVTICDNDMITHFLQQTYMCEGEY